MPDSPGLDPVTVDFELKRGIWIEGKITDKVTGKPVQGRVSLFRTAQQPEPRRLRSRRRSRTERRETKRGRFLPRRRHAGARLGRRRYQTVTLCALDRDDEFAVKEQFIPTVARTMFDDCALARIDPAKGVESVKRDVTLDPGWTFTGTVLGPDGKPLAGAWGIGLDNGATSLDHRETMKTAEFTVSGFNPLGRETFSSSTRRRGWSGWRGLRRTEATRSP